MSTKELFRAVSYMMVQEQKLSKTMIQRRFNVGYKDATFIMNMLLVNNLISEKKEYTPIFRNINDLERVLDKIYNK